MCSSLSWKGATSGNGASTLSPRSVFAGVTAVAAFGGAVGAFLWKRSKATDLEGETQPTSPILSATVPRSGAPTSSIPTSRAATGLGAGMNIMPLGGSGLFSIASLGNALQASIADPSLCASTYTEDRSSSSRSSQQRFKVGVLLSTTPSNRRVIGTSSLNHTPASTVARLATDFEELAVYSYSHSTANVSVAPISGSHFEAEIIHSVASASPDPEGVSLNNLEVGSLIDLATEHQTVSVARTLSISQGQDGRTGAPTERQAKRDIEAFIPTGSGKRRRVARMGRLYERVQYRGPDDFTRRSAKRARDFSMPPGSQKQSRISGTDRFNERARYSSVWQAVQGSMDWGSDSTFPTAFVLHPLSDDSPVPLVTPLIIDIQANDIEEVDASDIPSESPPPTEPIAMCTLLDDGSVVVLIVRCDGSVQMIMIEHQYTH